MIRQSGNILDIAQAICTRSNRVLGFDHQYRVDLLMMGSCRTGQLVQKAVFFFRGCTTCRLQWPVHSCQGSILLTKIPAASWDAGKGLDKALQSMSYFVPLPSRSLAWHRRMHFSHGYLHDLLFKIGLRSDRLWHPRVPSFTRFRHCI